MFVVTGITGQVGSIVANALLAAGKSDRCIHEGLRHLRTAAAGVQFITGFFAETKAVIASLKAALIAAQPSRIRKTMTLNLDPKTTALILIDLQQAIVGRSPKPHSAADIVSKSARLAAAFRAKGMTVIYVRVDLANMLALPVDLPSRDPNAPLPPASASELVPEAGMQPGDILITKRSWGAFSGTDLEKQLRDRGIKTIAIGGIATNFGVESTARSAAGLGFAVVFVEDAMGSVSEEVHRFAIETIFPRLGRVRSAEQVHQSLG